jgi:hypothetical protein
MVARARLGNGRLNRVADLVQEACAPNGQNLVLENSADETSQHVSLGYASNKPRMCDHSLCPTQTNEGETAHRGRTLLAKSVEPSRILFVVLVRHYENFTGSVRESEGR